MNLRRQPLLPKTSRQDCRLSPSRLLFCFRSSINALVSFIFAGMLIPQLTVAQIGNSDSIEISLFDPLINSPSEDGFRPITARINLPNGALAKRDQDFWIVQRLTSNQYRTPRQKVLFKKFTLKAGTNQVDVSFTAECCGERFQYEEMFVERDGNLAFAPSGSQDFCHSSRVINWSNRLEGSFNVLMIRGGSGSFPESTTTKQIDFRATRGDHESVINKSYSSPESPLGFDKVLWETLTLRFHWLRGDGIYSAQGNQALADYQTVYHFLQINRWFSAGTPEQMPDDWAALVNLDLLLISKQDLDKLTAAQLTAVQHWLAAGGRLSLTDCNVDKNGLQEIFDMSCGPRESGDRRLGEPSWQVLAENAHTGELGKSIGGTTASGSLIDNQPSAVELISLNRCPTVPLGEVSEVGKKDLLFYDLGAGRVTCTAQTLEEFQPDDWRRLLLAAYGNGKSASVRSTLGRRLLAGGPLEGFEITGVSQPPKLTFLGLITLFALIVGPIAYTVLYRSRRVNFLLVVVPLISLLTTLGLILFAVLADGFEFQTRRLSFSRLDQNAQRLLTLTNHVVFSGTNPRWYSADESEVLLTSEVEGRDLQQLQYSDTGARLSANWIRARMPHSVSTAAVQPATAGLELTHKEENGEVKVTVTNRLGGRLVGALMKIDNQWYEVGALSIDETAPAKLSSPGDFDSRLRPVFQQALPAETTRWFAPTNRLSEYNQESALVNLLSRPDQTNDSLIQDGQYLAVLEDFPGASQLKDYAKYQHQLHLIHGNW